MKEHLKRRHNLAEEQAQGFADNHRVRNVMGVLDLMCFFCLELKPEWESRVSCVAGHFQRGSTKADWEAARDGQSKS